MRLIFVLSGHGHPDGQRLLFFFNDTATSKIDTYLHTLSLPDCLPISLWLHTFTVGAPRSFLDHHLRCGDSLFGEWIRPVEDELLKRGSLLIKPYVDRAKAATRAMAQIEGLTDADIAEVRHSAETFEDVRTRTEPLDRKSTRLNSSH